MNFTDSWNKKKGQEIEEAIKTEVNGKISQGNIKTVNGQSILGSGNVDIIQVTERPNNPITGQIVQWVGTTTSDYINGYFYKYNGELWENIPVQSGGSGGGTAEDISYDNTDSGLPATNVQGAIDTIVPLKRSSPPDQWTASEKGRICVVETQSRRDFYICTGSYDYDGDINYRWEKVLLDGISTAQIGEELYIGDYCRIYNNGLFMEFSGNSTPSCIKFAAETTPSIIKTMQDYLDEKQDALTFDNVPTENSNNPVKSKGIKNFVNSSIENVAAYYITKNAAGDAFATKAELDAATAYYSGGLLRTPTRNDYCVVLKDESKTISSTSEKPTTRYIYDNGTWSFQYIVNNNGLTYSQWQTVNSGMTEDDKTKLDGIDEGAEINAVNDVQVDGESVVNEDGVAEIDLLGKLDCYIVEGDFMDWLEDLCIGKKFDEIELKPIYYKYEGELLMEDSFITMCKNYHYLILSTHSVEWEVARVFCTVDSEGIITAIEIENVTFLGINEIEDIGNKVPFISASSTNTEYPSAKCVYDIVSNIETALDNKQDKIVDELILTASDDSTKQFKLTIDHNGIIRTQEVENNE